MTRVLLVVAGSLVAVAGVVVAGMRWKWPLVLGAIKRLNRRVFNPIQLRSAGTPGAYAGIIRHVGRVSGTRYETPVGAVPTETGFAIVLPYGTTPDWLKNVVAAGHAELVAEGATHQVAVPRVVERTTIPGVIPDEFSLRLLAVDQVLLLDRAG